MDFFKPNPSDKTPFDIQLFLSGETQNCRLLRKSDEQFEKDEMLFRYLHGCHLFIERAMLTLSVPTKFLSKGSVVGRFPIMKDVSILDSYSNLSEQYEQLSPTPTLRVYQAAIELLKEKLEIEWQRNELDTSRSCYANPSTDTLMKLSSELNVLVNELPTNIQQFFNLELVGSNIAQHSSIGIYELNNLWLKFCDFRQKIEDHLDFKILNTDDEKYLQKYFNTLCNTTAWVLDQNQQMLSASLPAYNERAAATNYLFASLRERKAEMTDDELACHLVFISRVAAGLEVTNNPTGDESDPAASLPSNRPPL